MNCSLISSLGFAVYIHFMQFETNLAVRVTRPWSVSLNKVPTTDFIIEKEYISIDYPLLKVMLTNAGFFENNTLFSYILLKNNEHIRGSERSFWDCIMWGYINTYKGKKWICFIYTSSLDKLGYQLQLHANNI